MTTASPQATVPFLPVFAAVIASSAALARLVVGPGVWHPGALVSDVAMIAFFALVWRFAGRRPTEPLPRSIPWTRAALSVLFMPALFIGAAYAGELFIAFGQFGGMLIARATVRDNRLIEI